jgi:hypothetical protein
VQFTEQLDCQAAGQPSAAAAQCRRPPCALVDPRRAREHGIGIDCKPREQHYPDSIAEFRKRADRLGTQANRLILVRDRPKRLDRRRITDLPECDDGGTSINVPLDRQIPN